MNSWYSNMFLIQRPDPSSTRWWIDLFLLDTVVRDCITANANGIAMWRVHRRGKDDETGHRFSFLYYASREVYETVESLIAEHGSVKVLQNANLLRKFLHVENGSAIEATSDSDWPLPLQKAWPYYIMGVSQMALELVDGLWTEPIRLDRMC